MFQFVTVANSSSKSTICLICVRNQKDSNIQRDVASVVSSRWGEGGVIGRVHAGLGSTYSADRGGGFRAQG